MQSVYNIAEICARHGITDVVLSPGSRCAPLTIAFARHPKIRVRTVPDERAAAFIGLGLAQSQRRAVALVCTSGTAGLNYAPAVAEAYFQQIPLVIFTADRPPEWIDQLDGQTIRQTDLYGAHAKGSFTFPADTSHPDAKWHSERIVNEAINLAQASPAGPVQVNIPLREPFYPKAGEELRFEEVKIIKQYPNAAPPSPEALAELTAALNTASRPLFVFGQQPRTAWLDALETDNWPTKLNAVFVGDIISNCGGQSTEGYTFTTQHDVFLSGASDEVKQQLQPDLLITCGNSLISKALKNFLRQFPPQQHWHVQAAGEVADTFRTLTNLLRAAPEYCLPQLLAAATPATQLPLVLCQDRFKFASGWWKADDYAYELIHREKSLFRQEEPLDEFNAFHYITHWLPQNTALHLANSMAVRYANILGLPAERNIEVFANRGTSGIDGCTSTAVGAALANPGRPVVLLTGDVAFFYDRNALWHNYPLPNLRIVLFNNHAGGIFRLIDGPRQQPELEEFFETHQALTAENTARDFNLRYFPVSTFVELQSALPVFFAPDGGAALLEITTDSATNAAFFEHYRTSVKNSFL